MLFNILIWLYICITTTTIGYAFLRKTTLGFIEYSMFGIMAVTVYAEIFSLFYKVGFVANVILIIVTAAIVLILRKHFFQRISYLFKDRRLPEILGLTIGIILMVLFVSYGSSRGFFHYDSDLYHGQAIRWIEEYGVVKGLGNLHVRLAYNSASFALSALYSFSFLGGQSFHAVPGYLVLIVLLDCFKLVGHVIGKEVKVADFARIGVAYYCFNIFDEMVSPASDYFAMLFFLFSVVKALEIAESEEHETKTEEYALIAMMAVYSITLKLSAVPAVLLTVVPVVRFGKDKKVKRIFVYLCGGILISAPFFIRNYLLSGWLFYPSTSIDIFSPKWKIPESMANIDAADIVAYGRGYTYGEASTYSFGVWFPHWIQTLSRTEKVLFTASLTGVILFLFSLIIRKGLKEIHLPEITVILSFGFWLVSAPLVRYGQGFILLLPTMMAGDTILGLVNLSNKGKEGGAAEGKVKRMGTVILLAVSVIFFSYKITVTVLNFKSNLLLPYYVKQRDYGVYEMAENSVDGITVYTPAGGDQTGYAPFPATPCIVEGLHLMGDDICDGFYVEQQE